MRVGIVGSRRREDKENVEKLVEHLWEDDIVVSGGCRGVDTWAEKKAKEEGIETDIYLPDIEDEMEYEEMCEEYYKRNRKIVQNSDVIVAFVAPDRTGGTENTIKHADDLGVDTLVVFENGEVNKEV